MEIRINTIGIKDVERDGGLSIDEMKSMLSGAYITSQLSNDYEIGGKEND